jgi:APA family basic amino acid/polyamine antiporter
MAWALAGVMTITGALCCAELAAMMPKAGGQYVFLREAYGRGVGFLFGWSMLLVIQTGTIAAVAVAFANFLGVLVPAVSGTRYLVEPVALGRYGVSLSTQQLVAAAMILLLTAVNTRGLGFGRWIQNTFTAAKTAALFGLVVVGLSVGVNRGAAAFTSAWWDPWANGWDPARAQPGLGAVAGGLALAMLLGRAMVGPLFAQSAWNNVTFTAGEVKDPRRNLPLSLALGTGAVIAMYLLANIAYIVTLPLEQIQQAPSDRVATATLNAVLPGLGATLMAAAIMISTFGCNNGLILAGARAYYAMARDGLFFTRVGQLNAAKVPAAGLVLQGVWAAALVLPRTYDTASGTYGNLYGNLLDYVISAALIFYILTIAGVFRLRHTRPDADRPYRAFGYPVVPALYIMGASVILIVLFAYRPATTWPGLLIVLLGLPVYYAWRGKARALGAGHV